MLTVDCWVYLKCVFILNSLRIQSVVASLRTIWNRRIYFSFCVCVLCVCVDNVILCLNDLVVQFACQIHKSHANITIDNNQRRKPFEKKEPKNEEKLNSFSHRRISRCRFRSSQTHTQCLHILIFLSRFFLLSSPILGVWKWCCRQTFGSISCGTLSKLFWVNSCTSADTGSWFIDAYISWWFATVWKWIFITGSGIDWNYKK